MDTRADDRPSVRREMAGFRSRGWRPGQLLALLGLTGFAVSQPLLALVGEHPTLFTLAAVDGWDLVFFALLVALVPPLALWTVIVLVGLVDRRAGDVAFVGAAALLAGATAIQWAKTMAGLEHGWLLGGVALLAAGGFAVLLVRVRPVAMWTQATAVLPPIAVALLLVASPSADLLRSRPEAPGPSDRASRPDAAEEPPPVVFIMLDEFPLKSMLADDRTIDEVRFPNLADLASGATWYRDYTIMANSTMQSVPSILSGRTPSSEQPLWTVQPDNLFSLLAPTHDLNVIELATQLCGFSTCGTEGAESGPNRGVGSVLSQVADVWRDRVSLGPLPEPDLGQFAGEIDPLDPESDVRVWGEEGRDDTLVNNLAAPSSVSDFMGAMPSGPGRRPSLNYLHLMLPHQPWMRYPDGRSFTGWSPADRIDHELEGTDWDLAQLEQTHLYQAMYADRLVGEVIDELRDTGVYDEALIVVTADHGVHFDKARFPYIRVAQVRTMDSIAYVPLLIKAPGQTEGRIDDSNMMSVDVVPTIASELGVEIPWEVDGFAIGDPRIQDRGAHKELSDFGFDGDLKEVIEFDSGESRPTTATRNVGHLLAGEHSLAALLRTVEADRWLGRRVEELVPGDVPTGSAGVASLRGLGDQPGRMVGELSSPEADALVLLALDGVVHSAAPVDAGQFSLLVPQEAQATSEAQIQLLLVEDGRVSALRVDSW